MLKKAFLASLLLIPCSLFAASPSSSPLAGEPDRLGAELQQTFISAPPEIATKTPTSFIAYRKKFTLGAAPSSATLHIFADVRYLLWLNGAPVHRGPNRFDWHGPEYDSVEIGKALRAGANTIAIVVMGNGSNARMMNHAPGLTLRIEVGGTTVVRTDETWKWSDQTRYQPASVDWANIMDRIDTRVEDGDWTTAAYHDSAWKSAVKINGDAWGPLTARTIPLLRDTPVLLKYENDAKLPVTLTAGQQLKFSAPRIVQAYTMIAFDADAGSELEFNYAGIKYTAKAGPQIYISSDSCGFAEGTITVKSGRIKITAFQLMERLYPFDVAGSFHSSDELLNRLWAVCARSGQLLSEDAYIDCADRERAEWMDCDPPSFDVTRTAMSALGPKQKPLYADGRLLGEMVRRTALSVQPDDWVKAHTCSDRFDIHAKMEDRGCDWVEGARRYYQSTGNKELIREIWPVMVRQMNYFLQRRTPRGLVLAREWVVWGNPVGYVTCEGAGLNAFIYKALVDTAYLGNLIGEKPQAAIFAQAAAELSKAFNAVLWDEKTGSYYSGYYTAADQAKAEGRAKDMKLKVENELIEPTMFPALWALDQGIVPPARKARVQQYLLAHRDQAQRIMTFYYLAFQLYGQDTPELDREVLTTWRTKWKGMAEAPWQATWEEFDGASRAHCYGMFPGYFLSAYVLGVRPVLPASSQRILVEPHLGDLQEAQGTVVTEFGPVPVSWESSDGPLRFTLQVPAGVTATLRLPLGNLLLDGKNLVGKTEGHRTVVDVGPGKHQGTISPKMVLEK